MNDRKLRDRELLEENGALKQLVGNLESIVTALKTQIDVLYKV